MGRRVHPAIVPYNDGSQLAMQRGLVDMRDRERRMVDTSVLSKGGGLSIEAIPRELHAQAGCVEIMYPEAGLARVWRVPR